MMTVGRFVAKFPVATMAVLVLVSAWPSRAMAQDDHSHMISAPSNPTAQDKKQQNDLVQEIRRVTAQFQHHPPADRGLVCFDPQEDGLR